MAVVFEHEHKFWLKLQDFFWQDMKPPYLSIMKKGAGDIPFAVLDKT